MLVLVPELEPEPEPEPDGMQPPLSRVPGRAGRPLFFSTAARALAAAVTARLTVIRCTAVVALRLYRYKPGGATSRMATQTWMAADGWTDPGSSVASAVAALR